MITYRLPSAWTGQLDRRGRPAFHPFDAHSAPLLVGGRLGLKGDLIMVNLKVSLHLGALMFCLGAAGLSGCGGGSAGAGDAATAGGDGPGATTSGVSGAKRLDALTLDEKKKLCDFQAQLLGGYGASKDCGGGNTIDADASQADCLAKAPTTCAVTVSQAETCVKAISCADPIPASCAPLFQCH
jgi:hypothetical protein